MFILNIDGSQAVQLTNAEANYSPSWSPDGKLIAWHCEIDQLCVAWPDGTHRIKFADRLKTDLAKVTWSPDSKTLAIARFDDPFPGYYSLYTINADGTNLKRLTF